MKLVSFQPLTSSAGGVNGPYYAEKLSKQRDHVLVRALVAYGVLQDMHTFQRSTKTDLQKFTLH